MGLLDRLVRRRLVAGADLIVDYTIRAELTNGWVEENWPTDIEDAPLRDWYVLFAVGAFVTKQSAMSWMAGASRSALRTLRGEREFRLDPDTDHDAIYHAQVWQKPGKVPYLQTPAKGRGDDLEGLIPESVTALCTYAMQQRPDLQDALTAVVELVDQRVSAIGMFTVGPEAAELPYDVMFELEEAGVVPPFPGAD